MSIATQSIYAALFTVALLSAPVQASSFTDALKERATSSSSDKASNSLGSALGGSSGAAITEGLGALGMPSLGGDTASNAAGILQYCVKQNYLGGANVENVKGKLLDKAGLSQGKTDESYNQGLSGLLTGTDGKSLNLDSLKGNLKDKACEYVLENAGSML